MSSLKSKLFYQFAVSILYSAAPLLIFPYVSRVLGPEAIGKINFIDFTAQFVLLFTSFGIPLYGVREVARNQKNREAVKKLVTELVLIHLLISIIGLVFFLGILLFNQSIANEKNLILLAGFNIFVSSFSLDWLVQGREDFAFLSKRSFIIKITTVVAVFLLIKFQTDYNIYYLILIAGNIITILTDVVYTLLFQKGFTRKADLKMHVKPLLLFFLTSAAISFYTFFDTIILGTISGALAVGLYTTGLKVIRILQSFIADLGGVLLPRFSLMIQEKNLSGLNTLINKSLSYTLTTSLPLVFLLFSFAPEIIHVIAGNQYQPSVEVLRILSLLPLLIGLSNLFGIQILLPFKQENKMLKTVIAGSVSSILLNIILCILYREKGAAIACILVESMITLLMYQYIKKLVPLNFNLSQIFSILFCCSLFIPICWLTRYFLTEHFYILITGFILCLGTYFILQLMVFKNEILRSSVTFTRNLIRL